MNINYPWVNNLPVQPEACKEFVYKGLIQFIKGLKLGHNYPYNGQIHPYIYASAPEVEQIFIRILTGANLDGEMRSDIF